MREAPALKKIRKDSKDCTLQFQHQNQGHLVSISAIRSDFASESLSSLLIVSACCFVSSTRSDTWDINIFKDDQSIFLKVTQTHFQRLQEPASGCAACQLLPWDPPCLPSSPSPPPQGSLWNVYFQLEIKVNICRDLSHSSQGTDMSSAF